MMSRNSFLAFPLKKIMGGAKRKTFDNYSTITWGSCMCLGFFFFKIFIYLFMRDTEENVESVVFQEHLFSLSVSLKKTL